MRKIVIHDTSAADAVIQYLARIGEIGEVHSAQVDRIWLVLQSDTGEFYFDHAVLGRNTLIMTAIIAILVGAGFGAVQHQGKNLTQLVFTPGLNSLVLTRERNGAATVTLR